MDWKYSEDRKRVLIDPPKARLRITGHRLPTILGMNKWSTPFQAWCEITKLLKAPFEESKYTLFGKAVEPKIIEYVSKFYPNVLSIEEYYGNIFSTYQYNNFVDDSNIFGGVIDAVAVHDDMKTIAMICECKTSSHPEAWSNNQVPVDYLLQGALYSYMKGLDRVLFACTFPTEQDYAHPEKYEVNDSNTKLVVKYLKDIIIPFQGQYVNIEQLMDYAIQWWNAYIETGISPEFDEKADKEYLDIIRASKPCNDQDLVAVCNEADELEEEIKRLKEENEIDKKEKRLKQLKDNIKESMIENGVERAGCFSIVKKVSTTFDKDKFEKDEPVIYKKYLVENESYTLKKDKKKSEE